MSTITKLLTTVILLAAFGQIAANPDKQKQLAEGEVVPVSEWVRELKSISVAFRPKTAIDREDETPGFIERVGKLLEGKVLKVTGKVKSFQWKDGVGHVDVDVSGVSKADKLIIRFNASIVVTMDKEDAKSIKKGQTFMLRAVTDFIPGANGTTHCRKAQHLASITSNGATKSPFVGGICTDVYEVTIAGKAYRGIAQTNP